MLNFSSFSLFLFLASFIGVIFDGMQGVMGDECMDVYIIGTNE